MTSSWRRIIYLGLLLAFSIVGAVGADSLGMANVVVVFLVIGVGVELLFWIALFQNHDPDSTSSR